jgi:hypothetical protein
VRGKGTKLGEGEGTKLGEGIQDYYIHSGFAYMFGIFTTLGNVTFGIVTYGKITKHPFSLFFFFSKNATFI